MKTHLLVLFVSAFVIAGTAAAPSFAQMEPIMVSTDKMSYATGETIMVTGEVRDRFEGMDVTFQVISENNNIVEVGQLAVGQDNMFSVDIPIGMLWTEHGQYTIKVVYGGNTQVTMVSIEHQDQDEMPVAPSDDVISVDGGDSGMFDVMYVMDGGSVDSIMVDGDVSSLIVSITATDDGILTLTLPRELIDAKMNGCEGSDDEFFALVDGQEWEFMEEKDDSSRTLTIGFIAGSEMIEIIGTCAVPEFGTIAVIVLAAALVSIIAVSARSRLSMVPRY